jgi:hypothetical protein
MVDVAVSPVEAFPGGAAVGKIVSRFGDDVFRVFKGGKVVKKVGKPVMKHSGVLIRLSSKYSDESARIVARMGEKGRILVRSAEKNGFSAGRTREIIDFLGEKGEQGALFLERHWKLVLGGTGVYALWENEHYQRSQGNGGGGVVSTFTRGFSRVVDGVSWTIVAVAVFLASLWGIRWAVPTYKRIMPMIREDKKDEATEGSYKVS